MLMSWSETRRGGVLTAWFEDPRDTGSDNLVNSAVETFDVDFPWLWSLSVNTPIGN